MDNFKLIFSVPFIILIMVGFKYNIKIAAIGIFVLTIVYYLIDYYRESLKIKNEHSFQIKENELINSKYLKLGILILLVIVPIIIDYLKGDDWSFYEIVFYYDLPLIGMAIFLKRKNEWLIFNRTSIEYLGEEGGEANWDEVYRVEFVPGKIKIFYKKDSFIIVNLASIERRKVKLITKEIKEKIDLHNIKTIKK